MDSKKIFCIGYDSKEDIAYRVCKQSLINHSSIDIKIIALKQFELRSKGFYFRNIDPLASTEFTYTRFLIPALMDFKGWAVFCDCDILFLYDVKFLFENLSNEKAIYCVKHEKNPILSSKFNSDNDLLK